MNNENALEIARKRKHKILIETRSCIILGQAHIKDDNIQMAIGCYEQALKNTREQNDRKNETIAYLGLGHAYRESDQIQAAMEHYEKAMEIAREQQEKENESTAYLGLGHVYREKIKLKRLLNTMKKP